MSDQENEPLSERQFAEFLTEEVFSGKPRSVGEALQAADEDPDPAPLIEDPPGEPGDELEPELPTPPQPEPIPAEPVVVSDEPGRDDEKEEEPPVLGTAEGEALEEEVEEELLHVAWAKKKYGDDPDKWAKAAFDQEQHISRMANSLKEAEGLAAQWYEYAQEIEQQASRTQQAALPLSAAEEQWVEQAVTNPMEYARAAAFNGNIPLYHAVINRIAEESVPLATQIGTQVQMELQQAASEEMQQANGQQSVSLSDALGASFKRLGIDLQQAGPAMSEKIAELGEYHPYVQAILGGDDSQRDLAVQAVFDLVRAGTLVSRKVRDEQRAGQIKREAELRREAAGVVTGAPHTPPPKEDPFMAAMEEEWKARRQWGEE